MTDEDSSQRFGIGNEFEGQDGRRWVVMDVTHEYQLKIHEPDADGDEPAEYAWYPQSTLAAKIDRDELETGYRQVSRDELVEATAEEAEELAREMEEPAESMPDDIAAEAEELVAEMEADEEEEDSSDYECGDCGKAFESEEALNGHLASH